MANTTYTCPVCGGTLEWSPMIRKLKCPYCDSEFDPEAFEQQEQQAKEELEQQTYQHGMSAEETGSTQATDDTGVRPEDLRVYQCKTCGAEIVTDQTTMATACAFCGNPVVLTQQMDTTFRPKWIIPFRIDRRQVKDLYLKYIKSRPFTPASFFTEDHIEKIKGIYVPFWLYNVLMEGYLSANCERTSTVADARFIHTTHEVYHVERAGTMRLNRIPADASSKTPDEAMDSIEPFDLKDLTPFRMPYMAGYLAERYDEDANQCYRRAAVRARNTMERAMRGEVGGYNSVQMERLQIGERTIGARNVASSRTRSADGSVTITDADAEYALMPVYLLYTKYGGKDYLFAMNGQTGKAVGDVPVDSKKAGLFFLTRFLVTYGIIGVLFWLISFVM